MWFIIHTYDFPLCALWLPEHIFSFVVSSFPIHILITESILLYNVCHLNFNVAVGRRLNSTLNLNWHWNWWWLLIICTLDKCPHRQHLGKWPSYLSSINPHIKSHTWLLLEVLILAPRTRTLILWLSCGY